MGNIKSKHITTSNIDQWASSLGFSFPRNDIEEKMFDKLYSNFNYELTGEEIDPLKLIRECEEEDNARTIGAEDNWKMAARNFGEIPKHIIEKMKKNHNDKT
ncbi:MAG: hypothetical protein KAT68_15035 [Bacteroidales bacterium]|nr:hypothetical protein [Bacteroidales bacterium]